MTGSAAAAFARPAATVNSRWPPLPPKEFSFGADGALCDAGALSDRDFNKYCIASASEMLPAAVETGADSGF